MEGVCRGARVRGKEKMGVCRGGGRDGGCNEQYSVSVIGV